MACEQSIEPHRRRLARLIGAVDPRLAASALDHVATTASPSLLAETETYRAHAVRRPMFPRVFGEGLLLQPRCTPVARVVALPEADQTPEVLVGLAPGVALASPFARRLAETGCQVVAPLLIKRDDTWSGNPRALDQGGRELRTNQTHREWTCRQAFQMDRHLIGCEVQKVLAVVDWSVHQSEEAPAGIGVVGDLEGGLIALYAAAIDPRLDAALVSGYFDPRQRIFDEPIYRNVFGRLREFGDAEIASLIAPRPLTIEHSPVAALEGPPPEIDGVAAHGMVQQPVDRDRSLAVAVLLDGRTRSYRDRQGAAESVSLSPRPDEPSQVPFQRFQRHGMHLLVAQFDGRLRPVGVHAALPAMAWS